MAKIRKINLLDVINVRKLVSFICADEVIHYKRLFFASAPMTFFQNFFPLFMRKQPETYVAETDGELRGVISLKAQCLNCRKWEIIRLFLQKNSYDTGKQLVDYVVSHFGAVGATTFFAVINDTETELLELFVKGAGFRMCSCTALHLMSNINFFDENFSKLNFRMIKSSDSQRLADFFNENIFSSFKNSLQKDKSEFSDVLFKGLGNAMFRYILEDGDNIISYIEIFAYDNSTYGIDIIISQGYMNLYSQILSFAVSEVKKRNKNVSIYIKNRKYLMSGYEIEDFFKQNHFEMLENKVVLVKDFYKRIENEVQSPAIAFSSMKSNRAYFF
ncbi:GNAT family N-acetyltransferase [bacterium]|nr:GNAT family N-acetyltransferase [bacterium]